MKAELKESLQANEELKRARASGEEGQEAILVHIVELESREAKLNSQLSAANVNRIFNHYTTALL